MLADLTGNLTWPDLTIFALYILIVLAVGLWAGRNKRSGRDYFLAGRKIPWFVIGTSLVATSLSSGQMIGTVGFTYSIGLSAANWEWVAFPMYTLFLFVFLPLYMRSRIVTMPEFLERRYGPGARNVATVLVIVGYLFVNMAAVIWAGSLALTHVFGIAEGDVYWFIGGIILFTGVITLYGGSSSVAWTDLVQCILLIAGGTTLFLLALNQVDGGWSGMAARNPERFHLINSVDHAEMPWTIIPIALCTISVYYAACNQFLVQRVLCARSEWDARMGVVFAGLLGFLRPVAVCFAGLAAFAIFNGTEAGKAIAGNPDLAFPTLLTKFAPPILRGLILAGLIGAIISTLDSLANSTTTLLVLDVGQGMLKLKWSQERTLWAGRLVCAGVLVLAGFWAPMVGSFGSIFKYVQLGATFIAVPIAAVFVAGVFVRRMTPAAGTAGLIAGLPMALSMQYFYTGRLHDVPLKDLMYVAGMLFVAVLALMAIVSQFTKPKPAEQMRGTLWRPAVARLSAEERAVKRPWYANYMLWYVVFGAVFVAIYAWFW